MGSLYVFYRNAIFYREDNRYKLAKDGIEYIVHAHHIKTNISLVFSNQIKRLINASKNFVLMIVKETNVEQTESFKGCDPKLKRT